MYTQDQLYEFYKEFMESRLEKNTQKILSVQDEKESLLTCMDRLFQKCIQQQQEGIKQPVRYIHFFSLNLSVLTECYNIQINAFSEQSYMDRTESIEFWNPGFIMELFEKEIKEMEEEGRKKVFRFGYPQMMDLKKRSYSIYAIMAGRFILNHVEEIAALTSFSEMKKEEEFQMIFGGYMDKGVQIWPKVRSIEKSSQEKK